MHRRRFIGLVAASAGGLAGCATASPRTVTDAAGPSRDSDTDGPAPPTTLGEDVDLPVPIDEMRHPLPRDHIPAIVDPAFGPDWRGIDAPDGRDTALPDDAPVVGVERDGRARAYPLRVLDRHEAINDTFGGPLLVTYCPQCGTAVAARRRVDGDPTVFGVSGKLWRSDLVLYDRATESLWSQVLARAIRGPLTGRRLSLVPTTLTSWGAWRGDHPDGELLLPPPASNTVRGRDRTFDYFEPAYDFDGERGVIGYGRQDGELRRRTLVLGLLRDGRARAFPFPDVRDAGVVNDAVGDLPVAVTATPGQSMRAWVRRVDGAVREFAAADASHLRAAGSRWERTTGRAVDGPHEGARLTRANDHPPMFWHAWKEFNPETSVYGSA